MACVSLTNPPGRCPAFVRQLGVIRGPEANHVGQPAHGDCIAFELQDVGVDLNRHRITAVWVAANRERGLNLAFSGKGVESGTIVGFGFIIVGNSTKSLPLGLCFDFVKSGLVLGVEVAYCGVDFVDLSFEQWVGMTFCLNLLEALVILGLELVKRGVELTKKFFNLAHLLYSSRFIGSGKCCHFCDKLLHYVEVMFSVAPNVPLDSRNRSQCGFF